MCHRLCVNHFYGEITKNRDRRAVSELSCDAQVWKVRTGQCLRRYERPHTQGITSLAFSRDGSHILSASYDGLVRCEC